MPRNAVAAAPRLMRGDDAEGLPLSESVFRAIRRSFKEGVYRPGDRLREEDIAQRLGVSRTPVREAFSQLAARGLTQRGAGRGWIVRILDRTELLELYAFREILEGAAARGAAIQSTEVEVEALKDLCARFDVPGQTLKDLTRMNGVFHSSILNSARNRFLDRSHEDLQDTIALQGPSMLDQTNWRDEVREDHRAIADAIAARNPEKAELAARAHVRNALRHRLAMLASD